MNLVDSVIEWIINVQSFRKQTVYYCTYICEKGDINCKGNFQWFFIRHDRFVKYFYKFYVSLS